MVTSHLRPSGCVAFSTLAFKLAVGTGGCPQHRFGRRRTSQHPWLFELWVPLLPPGWLLLFFFFFFWTFSFQYPSQASSVLTRELELGLEKPSSTKARRRGPRAESEARREAFPTRGEAAAPSPSSSCNCACTQLRRLPGKSY